MLLRRFLAHPGRLFSRDELVSELWAGRVVTDDSLVQCVGELRAALGDRGHRIIRTVPRRGYRLDVPVETSVDTRADRAEALPQVTRMSSRPSPRDRSVLVTAGALFAVLAFCGVVVTRESAPAPIRIDQQVAARHTIDVIPLVAAQAAPGLRDLADNVASQISAQLAVMTGMRFGNAKSAPLAVATRGPSASRTASTYSIVVRATPSGAADPGATIDVQLFSLANGNLIAAEHFETGATPSSTLGSDIAQQAVSLPARKAAADRRSPRAPAGPPGRCGRPLPAGLERHH